MSPFIVLSVCMGNICRSPMAERLLVHKVRARAGGDLVVSESVGTGDWHVGQRMNPPAEKELRRRGVDVSDFRARTLLGSHIETADLVLTATSEQYDFVEGLRPDAMAKAFVLGEFGRLMATIDASALPSAGTAVTAESVHARGVAIVAAADAARGSERPRPGDELDDPWGRGDTVFQSTAKQIEESLDPFVELLLPGTAS